MKKFLNLKNLIIAITFCLVIISGIYSHQKVFYIFSLCTSLIVWGIQAEANRIGYLLGSINSLIYTIAYFSLGLYASALTSLFFAVPVQFITFLNWKKKAYKTSTTFKRLSGKMRILLSVALVLIFLLFEQILVLVGSDYAILDNAVSITSMTSNILCMLTFVEYAPLGLFSAILAAIMSMQLMQNNPAHITYVISSIYGVYCYISTFINVTRLYKEQQTLKK